MKKAIIAGSLLLLSLSVSAAEVKALLGIHTSKYIFPAEVSNLNHQQKTGLAFGVGYAFTINPKMALEANLVYGEKGAKTTLAYAAQKAISGTYSNKAIAVPLFFKYRLQEGASPYAALGPEFNFILAHTLKIPEYEEPFDLGDETKKFILAIHAALGYELPLGQWGLFAELRYNRWLSNLMKSAGASVKSESLSLVIGGIYYL